MTENLQSTDTLIDNLHREIAEREKAEASLLKEKTFSETIINSMPGVIYLFDEKEKFLRWNKNLEKVTGYSTEEIEKMSPLDFFDGEDKKLIAEKIREAFINGNTSVEAYLVSKGGQRTPYYFTAVRMGCTEGPCIVGTGTDITGHKKTEEELEAFSEKLRKSNSELEQFAYIASHDLQEPLRKVTAFGDRLKDKCADALGDQGKDYLDRMQSAAGRMQTLINDLLTYSRVTTKAQPFTSADLSTIAKEVLSDLEIRIEQVKGRVEVGELPVIDADPLQMRQLLQNLIGNALKFSKKDNPPVVKVHGVSSNGNGSASGNEYYQLIVEDNGIGFDEQYSERIFGVFQRLHGRSEYEGSGIGLSVCKKIVERHGGSITAQGEPGQGAKFIITVPVKQIKGEASNE